MGQRLLLVDSDRSFLKEHQVSLEAAFDLEVAASPDGVLQRLESGAYAAILICVEVADNKGYALCSTIRKNAKLNGVKIALISAKATDEEYRRHRSLKGRADLYLHKPMPPSALVASLAPLVPSLALDPDNPLGELVDSELGDDWLDGLKGAMDDIVSPPVPPSNPLSAPIQPPIPPPPLDARATAPPDTSHMRILEEQISALQDELRVKEQRLQTSEAKAQDVHRRAQAVTLNLDEAERGNRDVEVLKARLANAEASLHSLEGLHQAALLEVATQKEKVHTLQLEMAGIEATMRGQGRDLAELGAQLRKREAELEAAKADAREKDRHHKEEMDRLNRSLGEQQQAVSALEREKQTATGQLSEQRDRLRNLETLLKEIQEQARRGSDLARG